MIILGILAVCINAQSFGDLVKLFALFHFPVTVMLQFWSVWKKKAFLSVNFHTTGKVLNSEKLSKELLLSFCSCAQMSSLKKGILHMWNYKWTGFFRLQGSLFEHPRGKFACCFNKTCLCFALRARSVDTSLSPKAFLWKAIHRAVENLLHCWCHHAERTLQCLFTTCLNKGNSKWGLCFQWQQRWCFNVIAVCPAPDWLWEPAVPSGSGIPSLGRRSTAERGTASMAGGVAPCPPPSGAFEVTELDLKGLRMSSFDEPLLSWLLHIDYDTALTRIPKLLGTELRKERQLPSSDTCSCTDLNQGLTLTCGRYHPAPSTLACFPLPQEMQSWVLEYFSCRCQSCDHKKVPVVWNLGILPAIFYPSDNLLLPKI